VDIIRGEVHLAFDAMSPLIFGQEL